MDSKFFLKGGDEFLLSNPGNQGIAKPFNFNDSFYTLHKPGGRFSYINHVHEHYLSKAGIPEDGIPIENALLGQSSSSSCFCGNSAGAYGTVANDYIHVELNEPTPIPNIPSMDIITRLFIKLPAFFSTVLLSGEIYNHDTPGYVYSLLVNTNNLLITEASCDVASVWEAPYYVGASQAFHQASIHGLKKSKKANDKKNMSFYCSPFCFLGKECYQNYPLGRR
jgi:hypothetical protein